MKKFDFWFLFRFILTTALYCLESFAIKEDVLMLTPHIFPFILALYLTAIIVSFLFDRQIQLKVKFISDIAFLSFFVIPIAITLALTNYNDPESAMLPILCFFLELPMLICFIVWFIRDMRKLKKLGWKHFFNSGKPYEMRLHLVTCLLRISCASLLYYPLNRHYHYAGLMVPYIFWFMLIAYFLVLLSSLFVARKSAIRLLIDTDVVFLCMFFIQIASTTFFSYKYMEHSPEYGEILSLAPLVALFAICLIRDIRALSRGENETEKDAAT